MVVSFCNHISTNLIIMSSFCNTVFLLMLYISCGWGAESPKELLSEVGARMKLPCQVNSDRCGNVHSIKWYKGTSRIFVFSPLGSISRAEGDFHTRTSLHFDPNSSESWLEVDETKLSDEAIYKCDITYLEVRDNCHVAQFINLTTLVKPPGMRVTSDDGTEILNSTVIGPVTEDDEITLVCESDPGKPVPTVQWFNGSQVMQGDYKVEEDEDGVGKGRNTIRATITRGDLGARYECVVSTPALEAPHKSWLQIEVNVRPKGLDMLGTSEHWIQGTDVVLRCEVRGARPPANVTWFNGTAPMPADYVTTTSHVQADGTYDTLSELAFTATRFENEQSLSCEASNDIMTSRSERPMRQSTTLQVMYPPIVSLRPSNLTVNESKDIYLFCSYEANPATLNAVKWLKDGDEVAWDSERYDGGTTEATTLVIRNSTRRDHGNYTCVLENKVGSSESPTSASVTVQFKPEVNVTMYPSDSVAEASRENVTLSCEVVSGRPEGLTAVRWFLDGLLLKELPDCSLPNGTFCDVDPSKLLLEEVARSFHGNYSCVGHNDAGWGPVSLDAPLNVFYAPSNVELSYWPPLVVKRASMNLTCAVGDSGRPDNTTYRWTRGWQVLPEITTAIYTVDPVTLQTESNFTCTAVNLGGEATSEPVYIKVHAPPTFIERLPPYYGALMTSSNVNITCRVECSPLCSISWLKNGHKIDTNGNRYSVTNAVLPPDPRTNDFESVQSTLIWNMTSWPGGVLDRHTDNANYTCYSSGNKVGLGVRSSTFFVVEYPPENMTVSNQVVNVIEENIPEKVVCQARAYPEASYQWRREGEATVEPIVKGNSLILNHPVRRRHGGNYVCEASNRHGNNNISIYINVLFKPECQINNPKEVDGKLVLICSAQANPEEIDFVWRIKNENETIEEGVEKRGVESYLTLDPHVDTFRTYVCFANNSVGISLPCERDVSGTASWWKSDNENVMILIAVISGVVLMVIIICIIIIIVCRRKRSSDKCNGSGNPDKNDNSSPNDALLGNDDRAFYENLPFHGMQNPPNKPFRPEVSDLDYADVDYRSYGPINYKAASMMKPPPRYERPSSYDDEELL